MFKKNYFQVNVINSRANVLEHGSVRHEQVPQFDSGRRSVENKWR